MTRTAKIVAFALVVVFFSPAGIILVGLYLLGALVARLLGLT